MKTFIDCGGHTGEAILYAKKNYPGYYIHTFEANPELWGQLTDADELHREAVWDEDKEISFYVAGQDAGSTAMKGKLTANVDYSNPITVPAINLGKWIKDNFTEEDEVVMKLNIEGGEYVVIDSLIKEDSLKLIKTLYVSFHSKKVEGFTEKDDKRLKEEIKKAGVEEKYWY